MKKSLIISITIITTFLLIQNIIYSESTPAPTQKATQPQGGSQAYEDYNQLITPANTTGETLNLSQPVTEYSPTAKPSIPTIKKRKKRSNNSGFSFKQMADGIQKKDKRKTSLSFKSLSTQVKNKETSSPSNNLVEQLKRKNKK